MLAKMRRKRDTFALLMGLQAGAATLENSMEVPQKTKNRLPYDPEIALLGIYPQDTGVLFRRDTCTPMFIAALSTIAKVWKEPKRPLMDEWIKKMWYIYSMEYYSAIKKNEILPFATTWMELEDIMLSEIRERQISYDFTDMRTLRDKTDEHKGRETI